MNSEQPTHGFPSYKKTTPTTINSLLPQITMTAVTVSYHDLKQGVSQQTLTEAFGPDSLGIIIIDDLPEEFVRLRQRVLRLALALASLPADELAKLEVERSTWLVGWLCGKEMLAPGKPDTHKGLWYVNTAFHHDPSQEGPQLGPGFDRYPTYTTPNVWPSPDLPGMASFEPDLKSLINIIVDTAEMVARNCDAYCQRAITDYPQGYLERVVRELSCSKARLLHYFPMEANANPDDWCTEHLDHSCLTGLTLAMFIDEANGDTELAKCPDADAGLYIRDRHGNPVKVSIPPHCLAFQTGSTLEEVSKGQFKAVYHKVRGAAVPGVARNTLAVFCQPNLNEPVNLKENFAEYALRVIDGFH